MTKILVIEDGTDLRNDIIETLQIEGFEAMGAGNGQEGLALIRSYHPDLILCDVMMPTMDGYAVLAEIRKHPNMATIPFVFLTARTDRTSIRHGMVLGADDYLTKPFLIQELIESIQTQLKKRHELQQSAEQRLQELRETMITALPHELRTPLNTILGFSDMLIMEAQQIKPDQVASWATQINEAGQRLFRLVENYTYYVRLAALADTPAYQEEIANTRLQNAHYLIQTLVLKIIERADRVSDLTMQVADAPVLHCSHNDLIKIVDEVLDNAVKFSRMGNAIIISTQIVDNTYQISIEDQGRGISPEQIQRIGAYIQFDRWLYEQQGMGLGLAIVQQLIRLYQGTFTITGTIQQGTKVTFSLNIR